MPTGCRGDKKEGGPNKHFLAKHGLDEHSHPMDWFNALIPLTPKHNLKDPVKANVNGDKEIKFAFSNWVVYPNTKALLDNVGEFHHIYAGRFKSLTPLNINKMLGIYIIDGLAPSPQLKWKIQSQAMV